MATIKGPLFSLDASGSLAKTVTYSKWKGRNYVRQHVIPQNPQSTNQVNVRTAWDLLVVSFQGEAAPEKASWDAFAEQFNMSGFNQYISRGMKEYIDQLGSSTLPVSVSVTGDAPADVWTWA
jgi:hypothetical protein